MNSIRFLRCTCLTASLLFPAFAQTPPAPATCTTPPTAITSFNLERPVTVATIQSSKPPVISPSIQQGLDAGNNELRQQFVYNPSTNVITSIVFSAQKGSGTPTPTNTIPVTNYVSQESFTIDKIYASCKGIPSLMLAGFITQNFPASPFGDITGTPAAIGLGYTTDAQPKVNDVAILYAGRGVVYSAAASGTLSFPTQPVTPPGSNSNAPVITVAPIVVTGQPQVGISFTTSSPLNLPVTAVVTQVAGPSGGTTGFPIALGFNLVSTGTNQYAIEVNAPPGARGQTFYLQITATDTGGRSSTQVVPVTF